MSGLNLNLDGVRAIVTGAAGDIGRSIATTIEQAGGKAVLVDRVGAESVVALDVTDRQAIARALEIFFSDGAPVPTVLVNAAGIGAQTPFLEIEEEEWNRMVAVNLTGTFNMTQLWARKMVALGASGAVVNITSIAARLGGAGGVHYVASKGGADALTRGMAVSLATHGIRVNAVAPGPVPTGLNRSRWSSAEGRQQLMERVALGRLGTPEDIAHTVAFLASPLSAWTTGETVFVDGGLVSTR